MKEAKVGYLQGTSVENHINPVYNTPFGRIGTRTEEHRRKEPLRSPGQIRTIYIT